MLSRRVPILIITRSIVIYVVCRRNSRKPAAILSDVKTSLSTTFLVCGSFHIAVIVNTRRIRIAQLTENNMFRLIASADDGVYYNNMYGAASVCDARARALARFFSKSISDGGTQTRRARHPQRGKKKKKKKVLKNNNNNNK